MAEADAGLDDYFDYEIEIPGQDGVSRRTNLDDTLPSVPRTVASRSRLDGSVPGVGDSRSRPTPSVLMSAYTRSGDSPSVPTAGARGRGRFDVSVPSPVVGLGRGSPSRTSR